MTETVIIRKQQFRIKTSSQDLALQLRRELNDHLQVGLLAVYEEVFATMPSLLHDTIYIDKLSLDLGRCTSENFSTMLTVLLKQAMLKKLKQDSTDEIEIKMTAARENKKDNYSPSATDEVSALFHFFEKGYYPWWVSGMGEKKKPAEMIGSFDERALESMLVRVIAAPQQFGKEKGENIRKRFLQHLSNNDHSKIIGALIALQSDRQLKNNLQLLREDETMQYCCSFFSVTADEYREELIRFMLQQSLEQVKDVVQSFIRQLVDKKKMGRAGNKTAKKESNSIHTAGTPIEAAVDAVMAAMNKDKNKGQEHEDGAAPAKAETQPGKVNPSVKRDESPAGKSKNINEAKVQQQSSKPFSKHNPADDLPEEGVYVENGGLVILHPFFQPLFTELELLTTDGQFVEDDARMRAAVIMNYLFNGNTEYGEYDMLLNKLLCGIPAEEVLPADIVLTEKEINECDELMNTVIQYWEALKGAGKEAVQQTFFHRKAKVRFRDDHWLLQVERSAADILLDRLPWGIGIIRLPWLQYLIHVEW
jgi:hypothetical protein